MKYDTQLDHNTMFLDDALIGFDKMPSTWMQEEKYRMDW